MNDLEKDDDKLEVIELDTDEQVQQPEKPEEVEKPLPEEPDDDEINSYSARVQARIKKMSAKTHAERRAREQAEQQLNEAIRAIQATHAENMRLRQEVSQRETFLKSTDKARIEASLAQARASYRAAFEAGDADAIAATTAEIGKLSSQLDRNEHWQPTPPPPPPPEPPRPRPQPQVDPKTLDWQDRNNWFGRDEAMTGFALGVHRHLVNVEGVDPRSDDYFARIDSEMQKRFPEKFQRSTPPQARPAPVAPGNRAAGQAQPRTNRVELTRTQVQIAKKLGLTPEQYASELLKING